MYFHSNAFAFNPQTHLCFYTYLIKFEEEAVFETASSFLLFLKKRLQLF